VCVFSLLFLSFICDTQQIINTSNIVPEFVERLDNFLFPKLVCVCACVRVFVFVSVSVYENETLHLYIFITKKKKNSVKNSYLHDDDINCVYMYLFIFNL
jgi:hypothetical protein